MFMCCGLKKCLDCLGSGVADYPTRLGQSGVYFVPTDAEYKKRLEKNARKAELEMLLLIEIEKNKR